MRTAFSTRSLLPKAKSRPQVFTWVNITFDDCHEFHSLDLNYIYSRLELFNVLTSSHSWYITFKDLSSSTDKLKHRNNSWVLKCQFTILFVKTQKLKPHRQLCRLHMVLCLWQWCKCIHILICLPPSRQSSSVRAMKRKPFIMVIELSGVQFGLKSYVWFQNRTSAQREFDLKSQVWFQTKIARHEVQLPLYYIHFEIAEFSQY